MILLLQSKQSKQVKEKKGRKACGMKHVGLGRLRQEKIAKTTKDYLQKEEDLFTE